MVEGAAERVEQERRRRGSRAAERVEQGRCGSRSIREGGAGEEGGGSRSRMPQAWPGLLWAAS